MFGERLKELAKERGLTQEEIANKIGVSQASVSKWMNNIDEPTETYIRNTAIAFGVSVDYLLGLKEY